MGPRMTTLGLTLALLAAGCENEKREGEEKKGEMAEAAVNADLAKQATFPADSAQRLALLQVPGGRVTKEELEEEDGKLIYSFDIKVGTKEGVEEVHVDAKTGAVLKKEHESEAAEKGKAKGESEDEEDEKAEAAKKAASTKKPD